MRGAARHIQDSFQRKLTRLVAKKSAYNNTLKGLSRTEHQVLRQVVLCVSACLCVFVSVCVFVCGRVVLSSSWIQVVDLYLY